MSDQRPSIDFVWNIYNDVLWNVFRKNEMGDVMLPFVVLRRLDCMLESTKSAVRGEFLNFKDKVAPEALAPILKKAAGNLRYYNTSQYDLRGLCQEPAAIELNFRNYLAGFSPEVTEVLDHFELDKITARLVRNGILYKTCEAFAAIDLHLETVSNHNMGYIYEEIIRIANEQNNATAGEHFTPREVIRLMARLVFATEMEELAQPGIIRTIYDCACGTGGMLSIAKDHVLSHINPAATINLFGQEINEQSTAIAKSDLLITGENPDNIRHGNTFTEDRFPERRFNYLFANPPYGVSWKAYEPIVRQEASRFPAGLPATSDGQLLFIQHLVHKMEPPRTGAGLGGGARVAVVTNGSPLFTGDAGSGESEVRRWLIENDLLSAIVALPGDLFYNTGIPTYIWLLTNRKEPRRMGRVQLINAADLWAPMKKSLGNKRREIRPQHMDEILKIYEAFDDSDPRCRIFRNKDFGYWKAIVETPERDADGKPVLKKGVKVADPKKRDVEYVPLAESLDDYMVREVLPHNPGAWIEEAKLKVGYEIPFTKYFYQYTPPRPSAELRTEILGMEAQITEGLKNLFA